MLDNFDQPDFQDKPVLERDVSKWVLSVLVLPVLMHEVSSQFVYIHHVIVRSLLLDTPDVVGILSYDPKHFIIHPSFPLPPTGCSKKGQDKEFGHIFHLQDQLVKLKIKTCLFSLLLL